MTEKELKSYKMKYQTLNDMQKIKLRQKIYQDIEHHHNIIKDKITLAKLLI